MDTNGNGSNSIQHYVTALHQFEEEKRAVANAADALKDVVKAKLMSRKQAETREGRNEAYSSYLGALGMLAAPEPAQATKGQKKPDATSRN